MLGGYEMIEIAPLLLMGEREGESRKEEDKNLEELTYCEDLPKGLLPCAVF